MEFSEPSLSSTTAPTGKSEVSDASCRRPSIDVGGGGSRLDILEHRALSHAAVKPVDPDLKLFLQALPGRRPQALFAATASRVLTVAAAIGNRHAARIIEYNRDYVLLRCQLRHGDGRLP